jgi:hypothetical protein
MRKIQRLTAGVVRAARRDPLTTSHPRPGRGRLRIPGLLVLATATVAALLGSTLPVSANSDPHRVFEPAGTVNLPALPTGYCSFPVQLNFPVDREYGTVSTLPDGSTVITTTGSLMVTATNEVTGATLQVNAGGPGTVTIPPSGSPVVYDFHGRSLLLGTNQADFGLPSNLVAAAGPLHIVEAANGPDGLPFGTLTSLSGHPSVLTDVCAALSD